MKVRHYVKKIQDSNGYQNFVKPTIVGICCSPEMMESYQDANIDKKKTMRIANNVFRIASSAPWKKPKQNNYTRKYIAPELKPSCI